MDWSNILNLQLRSQTSELILVFIIGKCVNYNLIFMSIRNNNFYKTEINNSNREGS